MIITCPDCGAKNRIDEQRAVSQQPVCGRCHAPLATSSSTHPLVLSDATFERALADAGDRPMLVDCWADWCGPCRMLAPTIDQLASQSNGRWIIAKLNVDKNPSTAGRFQIGSIPAMLIFKNGRLIDQLVGLQPQAAIAARLERHTTVAAGPR